MGMVNNTGGLAIQDYKFNDTVGSTDSPYLRIWTPFEKSLDHKLPIFDSASSWSINMANFDKSKLKPTTVLLSSDCFLFLDHETDW